MNLGGYRLLCLFRLPTYKILQVRLFKRIAAGVLLTFGGFFLLAAISIPFDKDENPDAKAEQLAACLVVGIPLTAWGGWIAWSLNRETRVKERDRLQAIFFQLAKETDGCMSVMQFSMAANLPGDKAKTFLDERAKEFSANFEVDEQGGIFYRFPIKAIDLDEAED